MCVFHNNDERIHMCMTTSIQGHVSNCTVLLVLLAMLLVRMLLTMYYLPTLAMLYGISFYEY